MTGPCWLQACCFLLLAAMASGEEPRLPPAAGEVVDFSEQIAPIFKNYCQRCHGAAAQDGGLRLDRRQEALAGGDSGPVILPRNSSGSKLVRLVGGLDQNKRMPPEGEPLAPELISLLRGWIEQGANWPTAGTGE